jgi:flagellar biogenesis protein FliO
MRSIAKLSHPFAIAGGAFGLLGLMQLVPAGDGAGAGLLLARLLLALAGIVALALGAAPFLRRLPLGARRPGSRLRCEEQLVLDARHRLALVSVDGRPLLLGLTGEGCTLLKDLDPERRMSASEPFELEFPSSEKLHSLLAKQPEL